MNIEIRQARPDDGRWAVPLTYSSGPEEFDSLFRVGNKSSQAYLFFAFPTTLGSQSFRVFHVAVASGRIVGVGAFYAGSDNSRLGLGNFWNVLRFYGPKDMLKVSHNIDQMQMMTPPPEADAGFISQLGVQEEFRGRGVGTALIRHQVALARKMGLGRCVLDVSSMNSRAQSLYERLGFSVVEEHRWKNPGSKLRMPDQRRMELKL